jgi:XRE family transcriptional regulator, regulator of sulfur utilization
MTRRKSLGVRIGLTIRAMRTRAGYSQESFADAIHVHRTYMGTLERGRGNPTLEMLEKVVRGLNVSLAEFFRAVERQS